MNYYPAYLDLRGRPCLVIGGGVVAERKTLSLLEAGAVVTVLSPTLTPKLRTLADSGAISHAQKTFEEQDLSPAFLVIAATNDARVNSSVAQACRNKRILVNSVMTPEESSFIVPSVVERGDLVIAVSTSGASPALARKLRQELETTYGPEYGLFLAKLSALRTRVLEEIPEESKRRAIFQAIVDSDVLDLLHQGKTHAAELRMAEIAGLKPRP